jgi:hypothetical protein
VRSRSCYKSLYKQQMCGLCCLLRDPVGRIIKALIPRVTRESNTDGRLRPKLTRVVPIVASRLASFRPDLYSSLLATRQPSLAIGLTTNRGPPGLPGLKTIAGLPISHIPNIQHRGSSQIQNPTILTHNKMDSTYDVFSPSTFS